MRKTIIALSLLALFTGFLMADGALFPVKNKKGKFGYINSNGKLVVKYVYEGGEEFSGGFGAVKKNGLWGYIDEKGKEAIKPKYTNAGKFSEGIAPASNSDGLYGYVDASGNTVIDYKYTWAGVFSEGLALAQDSGAGLRFGYIDRTGAYVIKPLYDYKNPPRDFKQGLAAVCVDEKWGFINTKGETIVKPKYFSVSDFGDGLAAVQEIKESYVIPEMQRGEGAKGEWSSKGLKTNTGGNFSFIDTKGNVKIKGDYAKAFGFSDGLCSVEINGKMGYIDTQGKVVIEPKYTYASTFSEGTAAVFAPGENYANLMGIIDKSGNYILKPGNYFNAFAFHNGLGLVIAQSGEWMYVNNKGKFVWKGR